MPDPLPRVHAEEMMARERAALAARQLPADHGLSFSGGGIRSAAFHLGVLQALAQAKRLAQFGYLSTVSGGGYIGGWYTALVERYGPEAVGAKLEPGQAREADEIRFLRTYSRYLAPQSGGLAADTWALLAIWWRNTALNLLMIGLLAAAVLALPHAALALLGAPLGGGLAGGWPGWPGSAAFLLCVLAAAVTLTRGMTQLAPPGRTHCGGGGADTATSMSSPQDRRFGNVAVQLGFALPLLAAAAIAAAEAYRHSLHASLSGWILRGIGVYFESCLLGWLAAGAPGHEATPPVGLSLTQHRHAWRAYLLWAIPAGAAGGAAVYADMRLLHAAAAHARLAWLGHAAGVLVFGTAAVVVAFFIAGVVHIGLIGRDFPDGRREWWSRAAAWLLIYTLGWVAVVGVALYAHALLAHTRTLGVGVLAWALYVAWGLWAAYGPATGPYGGERPGLATRLGAHTAPAVFLAGGATLMSLTVAVAAGHLPAGLAAWFAGWFRAAGLAGAGTFWLGGALVLALLSQLLAVRLDVNIFSLHQMYRNRLVRCFLGARQAKLTATNVDPNRQRWPNPFTGFDPCDDLDLSALAAATYRGPYPLFNASIDIVGGARLACRQRRGASFLFTPLYCGFARNPHSEGYCETPRYSAPRGPSLGTAMAVSGAALSPNTGYHAAPAVAALMTLFNLRLGIWGGNPTRGEAQRKGPRNGLLWMLAELLGFTDEDSAYVYLGDGGHFENLGIYELVRRRCKLIVACDSSYDPEHRFHDLGVAIQKCRVDFGVEIAAELAGVAPAPAPGDALDGRLSPQHYATFEVKYPGDAQPGRLVYVKAALVRTENADLRAYALAHADFPNHSTDDQNFDAAEFENYRALGQVAMQEAIQAGALDRPAARTAGA